MLARRGLLTAGAIVLVAGCSGSAAGPNAAATSVTVRGGEFSFSPSEIRAKAGEPVTVTFVNTGTTLHTFTIPELRIDSGAVEPGRQAELTIDVPDGPGRFRFICTLGGHEEAGMVGALVAG